MISDNTAFLDLTKPENLSRIKIADEIKPIFCSVMKSLQEYFDKKGYINAQNYGKLFEKHIFGLTIVVDNNINNWGQYSKLFNTITLKDVLSDQVKETFCHEFLHFMIINAAYDDNLHNDCFIFDTFINEGYTELLTKEIFSEYNGNSYDAEVKMMQFYNFIYKIENNFFPVLRGRYPVKNSEINNFIYYANHFFVTSHNNNISAVEKDVNYNLALKFLIKDFVQSVLKEIHEYKFIDVNDYIKRVSKFVDIVAFKTDADVIMTKLNKAFVKKYLSDSSNNLIELEKCIKLDRRIDKKYLQEFNFQIAKDLTQNIDIFADKIQINTSTQNLNSYCRKINFPKDKQMFYKFEFTTKQNKPLKIFYRIQKNKIVCWGNNIPFQQFAFDDKKGREDFDLCQKTKEDILAKLNSELDKDMIAFDILMNGCNNLERIDKYTFNLNKQNICFYQTFDTSGKQRIWQQDGLRLFEVNVQSQIESADKVKYSLNVVNNNLVIDDKLNLFSRKKTNIYKGRAQVKEVKEKNSSIFLYD